jgi:hypothetical protein
MEFSKIFREERYYCNHLFRLLCHEKETGGLSSGLGAVLAELDMSDYTTQADIQQSEIYTEVAAFRDVFAAEFDKNSFIDKLYERFLPIISSQYNGRIHNPTQPSVVRQKVGTIHPSKYADEVEKFSRDEQDILFYREFSALFNAKPDLLIVVRDKMLWFEAKFWVAFSSIQLQRTRNTAILCSSDLFEKYFSRKESIIVLLGSERRHKKAQSFDFTRFLSWEKCLEVSLKLLPNGEHNYTSMSFKHMLAM